MDIFRIVGIGLLTCIVAVIMKSIKPEFHILVVLSGSVIILFMLSEYLSSILSYFSQLIAKANIDHVMFSSIIKILGIAFLTEFASGICIDSGNNSIGEKIVLGGKVVIICLALPIINSLLGAIIALLP